MALISPSRRLRRTPFSEGVEAAGVKGYTVYNRMLLPTVFRSVEEDYRHLKEAVQVWDVSCERQVELTGPDALRLLEIITPRDLGKLDETRCLYLPVVDQMGGMLNDPVVLQTGEDRYWVSIADSDLLLWIKAIGAANGFDVDVNEPDVSPLAVQGPKADSLMRDVFGDAVTELGFFRCGRFAFGGQSFVIARSGYSKQGGFDIYVEGGAHGMPLWNALMEAGQRHDVHAGCPNAIERVEGGLLSYGNDMDMSNTPLECGLERYVSAERLAHCFGGRMLREVIAEGGPRRMIRPIEGALDAGLPRCDRAWPLMAGDRRVGQVTSAAASPDFGTMVAIGMVDQSHWTAGTALTMMTQDGPRDVTVRHEFWI